MTTTAPAPAQSARLPTVSLGADLARTALKDPEHPPGALLGVGFSFDSESVLAAAESRGLRFDAYLSAFLQVGFAHFRYRAPVTVLVQVDRVGVHLWICSSRRDFQFPFVAGLGSLQDFRHTVVPAAAQPYGVWQHGRFQRVHPAELVDLPGGAVETFVGVGIDRYTFDAPEICEDIVSRTAGFAWASPVDLSGPMEISTPGGSIKIAQALYLWAEPSAA